MFFNIFKRKKKEEPVVENNNNPSSEIKTKSTLFQKVTRVWNYEDLNHKRFGGSMWNSEYTKDPEAIGKIFEHLRTAYSIRLYISRDYIEYTAETRSRGQVSGGCHRYNYDFFEFGIRKSSHRFDFYGEDRNNPTIKAFYDWWGNLVKPYEEEFDKDYNL